MACLRELIGKSEKSTSFYYLHWMKINVRWSLNLKGKVRIEMSNGHGLGWMAAEVADL